eukprot:12633910-Alexandrium_andersonii.AAC.1
MCRDEAGQMRTATPDLTWRGAARADVRRVEARRGLPVGVVVVSWKWDGGPPPSGAMFLSL